MFFAHFDNSIWIRIIGFGGASIASVGQVSYRESSLPSMAILSLDPIILVSHCEFRTSSDQNSLDSRPAH